MSSSPKPTSSEFEAVQQPPATGTFTQRHTTLIALALFGVATTGYFLGLTSPMTANSEQPSPAKTALHSGESGIPSSKVVPATSYVEMANIVNKSEQSQVNHLATLREEPYNPSSTIQINESEKVMSLAHRETRRAFNGAPPTVPHPIDQLNPAACMACHGQGLRSKSLRAGKMPHPYYSSCTQCHVEQQANFVLASSVFENTFSGMKAPTGGSRAYRGAPPTIPHSTWMRNDCLSCHGRTAAPGMESTHPWRSNCLQCHAESSQLNQTKLDSLPKLLPAPAIFNSK